jgi:elongation factor G
LKTIREKLDANPIPVQVPLGVEDSFQGVVDLIENKAFRWKESDLVRAMRLKKFP